MKINPQVLDHQFEFEGETITIRRYLYNLLSTLWEEAEGFSGKRPFGNSAWQFDIYAALIAGKFIKGTLDEDGYVEECDTQKADKYIQVMIKTIFFGDNT